MVHPTQNSPGTTHCLRLWKRKLWYCTIHRLLPDPTFQQTFKLHKKHSRLHSKSTNSTYRRPILSITMEVNSLYTNIEVPPGNGSSPNLDAKTPNRRQTRPENHNLLHLSLTRNDFNFHNQYYLQVKGTAMGKRFAPAYTNIYMAHGRKPFSRNATTFLYVTIDIWMTSWEFGPTQGKNFKIL